MSVMKTWILSLSLAVGALAPMSAHAVLEVSGVKFEDTYSLTGQQLQLAGAGMRKMMIIKVYALGLYVPYKDNNALALINQPGPKSMHVVMMRDVKAQKLINALVSGVEDNCTPAEFAALQPRLDRLASGLRAAGEVEEDSIVKLEYIPNVGTVVSHKNQVIVKDLPGEDFYRALMRIWLGENPVDRSLKAKLQGLD
ncbi:MAG: hypothetical protein RLZZ369_206 [Pseudomonadota bacterium]|jgi:hypothetical protein|nr:chalcone isomerase family protein [Aquabacterium sp.]MBP8190780.1 chalcone isomerase family protein [Aquabacterium sp.]